MLKGFWGFGVWGFWGFGVGVGGVTTGGRPPPHPTSPSIRATASAFLISR